MNRTLLALLTMCVTAHAGAVASLGDIRFWAGEGGNRAAIAIDWDGGGSGDEALVWGYRWDGVASGADALEAIVAADTRLYLKASGHPMFGLFVNGLGYDDNADGVFAISDQTSFDSDGFASAPPTDGAVSTTGDRYAEGLEDAYWHYGLRSSGGAWGSSTVGATDRVLADGDWDSYAFAVTDARDEFATNLSAAAPPALPGDFSGDGRVDLADYTVWRDTLNTPGGLTPADYQVWVDAFVGAGSAGERVPESSALAAAAIIVLLNLIRFSRTTPRDS